MDIKINRAEVLRYLGYKGGSIDQKVISQLDKAQIRVLSLCKPRYIHAVYSLEESMNLAGTIFHLEGNDIKRHLGGCNQVILMAVTLGERIDAEIRRTQISDMALATIIDATADAAVEYVCDEFQKKFEAEFLNITERYSPGYGDMPLSQQRPFCQVLDTERKIGLGVNENFLMTPRKSVTAIIGISPEPIIHGGRSCDNCNLRDRCTFRKEGTTCAK